jgi:hypothetical protein
MARSGSAQSACFEPGPYGEGVVAGADMAADDSSATLLVKTFVNRCMSEFTY